MKRVLSANSRRLFTAAGVALILDQGSKGWLLAYSPLERGAHTFTFFGKTLSLIPTENLTLVFGLLADWPRAVQTAFLLFSALLIFVVALAFFRSLGPGESANAVALGLLLGGGMGNLMDWGFHGAFIEIAHFRAFDASTSSNFNVADVCIGAGIVLLLVELLVAEGASRAGARPSTRMDA
ncbi:MAG: signal peptidase II [Myxococcota bacterium]|nr:signal peptidase II [Myxococcota bacterium]